MRPEFHRGVVIREQRCGRAGLNLLMTCRSRSPFPLLKGCSLTTAGWLMSKTTSIDGGVSGIAIQELRCVVCSHFDSFVLEVIRQDPIEIFPIDSGFVTKTTRFRDLRRYHALQSMNALTDARPQKRRIAATSWRESFRRSSYPRPWPFRVLQRHQGFPTQCHLKLGEES